MSDEFKACLVIAAGMLAFFTLGFVSGYASGRTFREELPPVVEVDTLVTRDPVYVDSPVPEAEIPAGYTIVPLGSLKEMKAKLALLESAAPDTVLVSLPVPVTERTYKGDDYEAVVSGYDDALDRDLRGRDERREQQKTQKQNFLHGFLNHWLLLFLKYYSLISYHSCTSLTSTSRLPSTGSSSTVRADAVTVPRSRWL